MATIADRVREVLDRTRWSQSELSRRAGLTRSHIGWIINNPSSPVQIDTLRKIAAGAKVSLRWLSTGDGSPDSDDTARSPSSTDVSVPHMVNAVGFDDALAEAKRREPKIRAHAWEAVAGSSRYILRGIVQPEDIIRLAKLADELADPARLTSALDAQAQRIKELEAQMAAELEAKKATATKTSKKGGRG